MAKSGTIFINKPDDTRPKDTESAKKDTESAKLDKLVTEASRVIFEVTSTFPFQIFPDRLVIDESKVTIIRRSLFHKREFPIPYDNLSTVKISRNLFFASIEIEVIRFQQSPSLINYLEPGKAAKAKRLISGILQAKKEGIDLSKLTLDEARIKLEKIGTSKDELNTLY